MQVIRAYLVSGQFRVHRAGCRGCWKAAWRSDSPGGAEEYASPKVTRSASQ